jgi:hypothetical protein
MLKWRNCVTLAVALNVWIDWLLQGYLSVDKFSKRKSPQLKMRRVKSGCSAMNAAVVAVGTIWILLVDKGNLSLAGEDTTKKAVCVLSWGAAFFNKEIGITIVNSINKSSNNEAITIADLKHHLVFLGVFAYGLMNDTHLRLMLVMILATSNSFFLNLRQWARMSGLAI